MMKIILWTLVFYVLFRFITRFVLPILKVTRMASSRMRDMQQQMEEMQQKANNPSPAPEPKIKEGDYIEYEEIK